MIDNFDSECLVHIYRYLQKKCDLLDAYIKNHAYSFSLNYSEFGAEDVYTNIINLMARKNQLINLKIILDEAIENLDKKDKQIIYLKINYSLNTDELCGILNISARSVFRRIEHAISNLTQQLNNSKHINKLIRIMETEIWIHDLKEEVKLKRNAFRQASVNSL